jgi:hypothetical protein
VADFTLELVATPHHTIRGQRYDVYLNGSLLLQSQNPEFDACRALQKLGYSGSVAFRRPNRDQIDMKMTIDWGAKHTVSEQDRGHPRIVQCREMPDGL